MKSCLCGHSPTGQCLDWHNLSLEGLIIVEQQWLEQNPDSDWVPQRLRPTPEPQQTDNIL